jgi:uroporphyrinogen-III synthase
VLAGAVERVGAEAILVPMIEVAPPDSFTQLDSAIQQLSAPAGIFDCLIFTSANAVHALANRARELAAPLHPGRIAVIGPATAKAVVQAGIAPPTHPVIVPPEYVAESLAATLIERCPGPQHFLLVRAEEARDVIPSALEAAGHTVHVAAAYRNRTPADTLPALAAIFATPQSYPDVITFTSSSTARNLVALLETIGERIPPGIALASIGPITSATLRELGYEPTFEAREPEIESLADSIAQYLHLRSAPE